MGKHSRAETRSTEPFAVGTAAARFDAAARSWLRLPRRLHALALTALTLLIVVRYADLLLHPEAWIDEEVYERGFEALLEGRSPYFLDSERRSGFYYPPPFAHAGAFLYRQLGPEVLRFVLRAANVLAVAWLAWLAVAWLPAPRGDGARGYALGMAVAALLVVVPVGVHFGFKVGNISFSIVALAATAVVLYPRWPVVSGILLGLSLVLKPLAPATVAVLFAQSPRAPTARAGRLTALVAGITGSALLLPFLPALRELLNQRLTDLVQGRILSTYRLAELLGLPADRAVLFVLLTLGLMALTWRFGRSHCAVAALALGGVVATAPALWSHTMTVFFPVLVIAGALAYGRWSGQRSSAPSSDADRARAGELTLVSMALLAVLLFESGGFDHLARAVQIAFLVPLLLIPLALVAYVLWASSGPTSSE